MRCSEMNVAGIVIQYEVSTDLLMICQEEEHVLLDHGLLGIT